MQSRLTGKVVLVTGAGKGTGRLLAERLADYGAHVAAADLTPINLDETVARIQSAGGHIKAYITDIAKKLPIQGLLNQVVDDLGRLDILANCAEVEPEKTILEMDEWDWVRTLDVNLTGAFLLTQSAGRMMKAGGGGIIVHIAAHPKAARHRAAYLASKAGLQAMVDEAAHELNAFGIKVALFPPDPLEKILEFCLAEEL